MPSIAKTNSDLVALDTIVSNDQIAIFKLGPMGSALFTADTQAGGEGTEITVGGARRAAGALGGYTFQTDADGNNAVVIMDKHNVDVTSIQARLENVFGQVAGAYDGLVAEVTDLFGIADANS